MLTEQEIINCWYEQTPEMPAEGMMLIKQYTKAIEAKARANLIEEIKAQRPAAWRFDINEDCYNKKWGLTESGGLAKSGDPRAQPLYPLPEGD